MHVCPLHQHLSHQVESRIRCPTSPHVLLGVSCNAADACVCQSSRSPSVATHRHGKINKKLLRSHLVTRHSSELAIMVLGIHSLVVPPFAPVGLLLLLSLPYSLSLNLVSPFASPWIRKLDSCLPSCLSPPVPSPPSSLSSPYWSLNSQIPFGALSVKVQAHPSRTHP